MTRQPSETERRTSPEVEERIRVRGDAMHDIYPQELTTGVATVVRRRVSWGAVIAGLFTTLSTMIVLSVLGLAVGLSAAGADTALADVGVGVGIWGGIAALIAFFIGGWMAGWARPNIHEGNGLLQGALVWMVAVVLLVYGVAAGTGAAVGTAAEAAAPAMQGATQQQGAAGQAETQMGQMQSQMEQMQGQTTQQDVEQATQAAAGGAWGTLIALLLGLGAALVGGLVGTKTGPYRTRKEHRERR